MPNPRFDFARATECFHPGGIHLIGFEFDGTACFRKGTVAGPNALREVSDGIESYSPYLERDLQDRPFYDLGNLQVGNSEDCESNWRRANEHLYSLLQNHGIKSDKLKILTIGGEHSISYAPIKKYLEAFPDLLLVHLDAHADLRDGHEGFHFSHASIIRRVLDHFGAGHQLIQYGIRSGTKEEYQWMAEHRTLIKSRQEFLNTIENISKERPIYLTLDLDYFDPSIFPGTGTPEPGGEDFHSFIALSKILATKNLVGADVTELSPDIDPTGNSSIFAAKVVRELLLTFKEQL